MRPGSVIRHPENGELKQNKAEITEPPRHRLHFSKVTPLGRRCWVLLPYRVKMPAIVGVSFGDTAAKRMRR